MLLNVLSSNSVCSTSLFINKNRQQTNKHTQQQHHSFPPSLLPPVTIVTVTIKKKNWCIYGCCRISHSTHCTGKTAGYLFSELWFFLKRSPIFVWCKGKKKNTVFCAFFSTSKITFKTWKNSSVFKLNITIHNINWTM